MQLFEMCDKKTFGTYGARLLRVITRQRCVKNPVGQGYSKCVFPFLPNAATSLGGSGQTHGVNILKYF